jgi:hypothetical protein
MNYKAYLPGLKPTIGFLSVGVVIILILVTFINPARREINDQFFKLGISPGDDITEAIDSTETKINKELNNNSNIKYSFFDSMELRQMRMMIDSIKISLTTGFQFTISELDETTKKGLKVKNFNIKGRSSFLGLSGFISSIENHPKLMRFSSGEIKYYGVLEESVAFVEYDLILSVFLPTGKFYLPPFEAAEDSLFEQVDVFLPFIQNISYYSDPSAIDLSDYELKSIKGNDAYFQHIRFNEQKILRAGDEVKNGIITEINGNIVKIMMIKGSGADFIELKQPE